MTNIDQFESVFKSAVKTPFHYERIRLSKVLVVIDRAEPPPEVESAVRQLIAPATDGDAIELRIVHGQDYSTVGQLLDLVAGSGADLVATYRNLHTAAWQWPHSLGDFVDVLTQVADPPVLLLPHPQAAADKLRDVQSAQCVMAITDHLTGDDWLVNYAAALAAHGGKLILSHVEDDAVLQRVLAAIEKIPEIDSEIASEKLVKQLLKEPSDYIASCRAILQEHEPTLSVDEVITSGHLLQDHLRIVQERCVDLLVLNTKDDDQAAMHGLAHPLSVELRHIPLLLL